MMRSTGAIGDLGGDTTASILQGNLPNLTLNASITNVGDHAHTYTDVSPNTTRQHGGGANILLRTRISTLRTTTTNGNHLHTVNLSSGGSDRPVAISPPFLQTKVFIFLGV
jgi:hypothetical protein